MSRPPSPTQPDPFGSALTDLSQVALPLGPSATLHNIPPASSASHPATPLPSAPSSRAPSPGPQLDLLTSTPVQTAAVVPTQVQLDKPATLTMLDEEGYIGSVFSLFRQRAAS